MTPSSNHLDWIDRWKGVLILLVIVGHVVGAGHEMATAACQPWLKFAYQTIYAFHMPAFFFLAGMMFKESAGDVFTFLRKKFLRLMVPYFVFGFFSLAVYWILSSCFGIAATGSTTNYYNGKTEFTVWQQVFGLLHAGGAYHGAAFRMNSVLWFLPCMFTTSFAFFLVLRAGWCRWKPWARGLLLAATVGLAWFLTYGFRPTLPMGLGIMPRYLVYMLLGKLFGDGLKSWPENLSMKVLAGVGLVVFPILAAIIYPDPICQLHVWYWYPCYIPLVLCGIVVSMVFARVVTFRGLALCGSASLTIMLLHKFVVLALQWKVGFVTRLFKGGVLAAFAGTVLITVVALAFCLVADWLIRRFCPWAIGLRSTSKVKEKS